MTVLVDPYTFAESLFVGVMPSDIAGARVIIFIIGYIAAGGYAMLVWWMYKAMVKNFDMTIRRQSR